MLLDVKDSDLSLSLLLFLPPSHPPSLPPPSLSLADTSMAEASEIPHPLLPQVYNPQKVSLGGSLTWSIAEPHWL